MIYSRDTFYQTSVYSIINTLLIWKIIRKRYGTSIWAIILIDLILRKFSIFETPPILFAVIIKSPVTVFILANYDIAVRISSISIT